MNMTKLQMGLRLTAALVLAALLGGGGLPPPVITRTRPATTASQPAGTSTAAAPSTEDVSDPDFKPPKLPPQPAALGYMEQKDGQPVNYRGHSLAEVIEDVAKVTQTGGNVIVGGSDAPGEGGGGGGATDAQNHEGAAVLLLNLQPVIKKIKGQYILSVGMGEKKWSEDPDLKPESKAACAADRVDVEDKLRAWRHALTDREKADFLAGRPVNIPVDGPFSSLRKLTGGGATVTLNQKLVAESGSAPGARDDDEP